MVPLCQQTIFNTRLQYVTVRIQPKQICKARLSCSHGTHQQGDRCAPGVRNGECDCATSGRTILTNDLCDRTEVKVASVSQRWTLRFGDWAFMATRDNVAQERGITRVREITRASLIVHGSERYTKIKQDEAIMEWGCRVYWGRLILTIRRSNIGGGGTWRYETPVDTSHLPCENRANSAWAQSLRIVLNYRAWVTQGKSSTGRNLLSRS